MKTKTRKLSKNLKLTPAQKNELMQITKMVTNFLQFAEDRGVLSKGLDFIREALKDGIAQPSCDWRVIELVYRELLDGNITIQMAASQIVLEAEGITASQRL